MTGGIVYDVFVQDDYAYVCAGGMLTILDVSAPSNPTKSDTWRCLTWLMASMCQAAMLMWRIMRVDFALSM